MQTKPTIQEQALAKLESSGIDARDAKMLGIKLLSAKTTQSLHPSFSEAASLKIPYFFPDGSPMTINGTNGSIFYRLRYLQPQKYKDHTGKIKSVRYVQKPGSGVAAYFPQNIDWTDIVFNSDAPLIITEGELKAAKACKEDFPTIGLGGVFNFRSASRGFSFLPELEPFEWECRNVYIAFDSDFAQNPQICSAINQLSAELLRRGAIPHVVVFPPRYKEDGELTKMGLDDYLVDHGANEFSQLLNEAKPFNMVRGLYSLNQRVIFIRHPVTIVERESSNLVSTSSFKEALYATENYYEPRLKQDGTFSRRPVSLPEEWIHWPLRAEADALCYVPGASSLVTRRNGAGRDYTDFNLWRGWGTVPVKGDVRPFLKLFNHLTTGLEPDAKQWLLRWMAYPIQHPGTKLYTTVLFHGLKQGTGKSLLGMMLGKIYGDNFSVIKERDLAKSFNSWAKHKQFILGDDITGSDKRQETGELRKMITQEYITIDEKYVPAYTIKDCLNYFFTSNLPDAFFLEGDDRRCFIHEITVGPLSEEFYAECDLWLSGMGASYLHHYLLNEVDLGGFLFSGRAPTTAAKERMIADGKSDLASWVESLLRDPPAHLKVGKIVLEQDLFTSKELLALYDPSGQGKVTANGVGRELKRAGVRQAWDGRTIFANGRIDRYYILRNEDKWINANPTELRAHIDGFKEKAAHAAKTRTPRSKKF